MMKVAGSLEEEKGLDTNVYKNRNQMSTSEQ